MNKLVVHIGSPKTGTSSIQNSLAKNNNILQSHGWSYPDVCLKWSEICWEGIPYSVERRRIINGQHLYDAFFSFDKKMSAKYIAMLEKLVEEHNIILSEECIFLLTPDNLSKLFTGLKAYFPNIQVVVYLRRGDYYLEALWNQAIKEYFYSKDIVEYAENNMEELNYLERLTAISDVIGIDNVIVRPFEKGQLHGGDVVSDFLDVLGIDIEQPLAYKRENERLDGKQLCYKKYFNELINKEVGNISLVSNDEIYRIFTSHSIFDREAKSCSFMPDVIAKEIIDSHRSEYNRISDVYLGGTPIFTDYDVPLKEYRYDLSIDEKVLIEMLADTFIAMNGYIKEINKELKFVPTMKSILSRELKRRCKKLLLRK